MRCARSVDDIGLAAKNIPGVGPNGVTGHLCDVNGVLHVIGGSTGNSGNNIAVTAGYSFAYKAVFICKSREYVAGGTDLFNNRAECIIAQFPVAFPCLKPIELGRLDLFEVGKNRVKVRI